MKGLEASEILLSDSLKDNIDFRLDAEYFSKKNIELTEQLDTIGFKRISEIAAVTDGIHTSIPYCETSNVKLVSATSPRENYFDLSRNVFISEKAHKQNPRTALQLGDVIISTVGTIGNCAVVTPSVLPANTDRDVGIIRIQNQFLPNYVSTFLLTKYGKFQSLRESTGNMQLHLFIYKIKTLKIANLSFTFQKEIEEKVKKAHLKREQSQTLYRQAEDLLLENIGLKNFQPLQKNINIKTFKKSFLATGRLDAEYYQPKYEEIEKKIKSKPYSFISREFDLNKNIIDYSAKQYNYIEIGDINVGNGAYNYNSIGAFELPANAKIKCEQNDLLVSNVRPNRGAVSIIQENIPDLVVSGAFTVLREKTEYRKEVLFVLLRTLQYREWLLKYNVGTSYPVIKNEDILNLPIPLIAAETQRKIAVLIRQSFTLRGESDQLLEQAKTMIEREIEKR